MAAVGGGRLCACWKAFSWSNICCFVMLQNPHTCTCAGWDAEHWLSGMLSTAGQYRWRRRREKDASASVLDIGASEHALDPSGCILLCSHIAGARLEGLSSGRLGRHTRRAPQA